MRVHSLHKVEYAETHIHSYYDCLDFITRLRVYCDTINNTENHGECEFYVHLIWEGEGSLEYEVDRGLMQILSEKPAIFYADHPEDLETIKDLYAKGDPDNDVIYLSCF